MVGTVISHYKILEKLGEGGMGVVYKAHDLKLDRTVALKFLPRYVAASAEQRHRMEAEARAAAALSHPNVTHIYAIEEADDELFIAMEYVVGRNLKEQIGTTPMPIADVIEVAKQIALGLQAAHKRGIIHRDIKSANVMLTDDGQVKIMDFGLAKTIGSAAVTTVGSTLGTAAYMSPEQTRGEEADQRSDIWSLGVVLYEMLTGRLPFGIQYEQAVIYAIQNNESEAVSKFRSDVPPALGRIVDKALKKNRDERYQSIDAMLADLRPLAGETGTAGVQPSTTARGILTQKKWSIAAGGVLVLLIILAISFLLVRHRTTERTHEETVSLRRLAVLPFSNISGDPKTEFLSFALADQIIGKLTYVRTVLVRPSSMIRRFQHESLDPTDAGRTLNVDYLLTGNYLKESNTIRLNLELVDLKTQGILWHDQIQTEYESAFHLEDIVAEKVVGGLQLQFSPDERQRIEANVPRNTQAYEYYLRSVASPLSIQGDREAITLLRQAIALDSSYAPAYGELGYRLHQIASYTSGTRKGLYEAEQAGLKALSLNSSLLSVLGGLTSIYAELGKTEEAFETARRALQINPNSPDGLFYLGYVYRYAGLNEQAEKEMEKAVKLDPRNPRFRSISITYEYMGKYEQALEALDLDPDSPFTLSWKADVYMRMGKNEQAISLLNRLLAKESEGLLSSYGAGQKAYLEGDNAKALAIVHKVEAEGLYDGEVLYSLASQYALLRDTAGCVRTLQQAIDHGFFNYPRMLTDSFFDPVRGSREFQTVLEHAKAKHEAFKNRFAQEDITP